MADIGRDPQDKSERSDWWRTSIIDMQPGVIRFFGYPIEELIGNVTFPQMIWLMLRGEIPSAGKARLLEIALTSSVDHGPQAPSIAIARMAATCGVDLNNSMASAVNVLGDVHGGAGEQVLGILHDIAAAQGPRRKPRVRHGNSAGGVFRGPREVHSRVWAPFSPRRSALAPPDGPREGGSRSRNRQRPVQGDWAFRGSGAGGREARQACAHEYRRRDRGHIRRTWLSAATGARTFLSLAVSRHSGACLGADLPRGQEQGPAS